VTQALLTREELYERTLPAAERVPHSPELQAIFDLGNELEKFAIRKLQDMGAEIPQTGRDHSDAQHHLSGHVDARIRLRHWKRSIPLEIKGLNEHTAGSIRTIHDIRDHHQAWIRKYHSQLQTYLYFEKEPLGLFALLNKTAGTFRFVECPLDQEHVDGLLRKADRIQLAVLANEPPAKNQSSECRRCQFATVCCPDIDFGDGVGIIEDPDLEAKIARREELSPLASEFHSLDNEIKDRLPEKEGELLVGDFVIARKQFSKRAELKPRAGYSYYRTDIRKLTK
jgi:CRISPR/Cas system-associated exonuclease Cas4 (RecB family)